MRKETLVSTETQTNPSLRSWMKDSYGDFSYRLSTGIAIEEELDGCGGCSECTFLLSQTNALQ